ncbi:hypothetical protein F383_22276 [Gossypium arboreum]|uniref:Uncharacterized protein n=1 Tax=Gossypium arboreum TaxID=29729 RepID=A0A0B0NS80_GOSAR|nr:hypothetical protein F383_22276 [Gossypium arboreum]
MQGSRECVHEMIALMT